MVAEIDREAAVDAGSPETTPADWIRTARFEAGDGTPGRALDTLERAALRFPADAGVQASLADLYLFFGLAERAEPILRPLAAANPGDAAAARAIARSRELLRPAAF